MLNNELKKKINFKIDKKKTLLKSTCRIHDLVVRSRKPCTKKIIIMKANYEEN
jgi:hypothetical protein